MGFDYVVAAELAPEPEEFSAVNSAERSSISAKKIDDAEQEKGTPPATITPSPEDENQGAADMGDRGGGGGGIKGGDAAEKKGAVGDDGASALVELDASAEAVSVGAGGEAAR